MINLLLKLQYTLNSSSGTGVISNLNMFFLSFGESENTKSGLADILGYT